VADSSAGCCLPTIVYVDCRTIGQRCVRTNACEYGPLTALGIIVDMEGKKELLGMWMSQNEEGRCILARGVH